MIRAARIAPSILAADFSRLGEEVGRVEPHVEWLHLDVMDGHFVPNLSLGIPVIRALRPASGLLFDCHMMTLNPDAYLEALAAAGVDQVTVHIEVFPDPTEVAARTRDLGMRFGLVLNPPTPVESVEPFVELCDVVLVMSVHPGFGGQSFIPDVLDKVVRLRKQVDSAGLPTDIQIDGGIGPATVAAARAAGADVFVAGSAIFQSADPAAAVAEMRSEIARVDQQ